MVQSHHGAATVSGERSSREATGLGRDCRAWKRDDPHPLGRRKNAAIRESGDPTDGKSSHPSRQREAIMSSFVARVFLSWLVGLSAAGFLHSASAAEGERSERSDVAETPEVFISATKTEVPVKQVTSAVETITGEQMQQRKIKTVVEALRLAQGLAVFQSGGPGTLAQVRMRGGTPQQTLVLIDGAIVNSATDGTYNFANLTTDNIERI